MKRPFCYCLFIVKFLGAICNSVDRCDLRLLSPHLDRHLSALARIVSLSGNSFQNFCGIVSTPLPKEKPLESGLSRNPSGGGLFSPKEHCSITGFAMRNVGELRVSKSNKVISRPVIRIDGPWRTTLLSSGCVHWEVSAIINSPSQKTAELKTLRVAAGGNMIVPLGINQIELGSEHRGNGFWTVAHDR